MAKPIRKLSEIYVKLEPEPDLFSKGKPYEERLLDEIKEAEKWLNRVTEGLTRHRQAIESLAGDEFRVGYQITIVEVCSECGYKWEIIQKEGQKGVWLLLQ